MTDSSTGEWNDSFLIPAQWQQWQSLTINNRGLGPTNVLAATSSGPRGPHHGSSACAVVPVGRQKLPAAQSLDVTGTVPVCCLGRWKTLAFAWRSGAPCLECCRCVALSTAKSPQTRNSHLGAVNRHKGEAMHWVWMGGGWQHEREEWGLKMPSEVTNETTSCAMFVTRWRMVVEREQKSTTTNKQVNK